MGVLKLLSGNHTRSIYQVTLLLFLSTAIDMHDFDFVSSEIQDLKSISIRRF